MVFRRRNARGTVADVVSDFRTVVKEAQKLGLELNTSKCELFVWGGSAAEREQAYDAVRAASQDVKVIKVGELELLGAPMTDESIPRCLEAKIGQVELLTDRFGVLIIRRFFC